MPRVLPENFLLTSLLPLGGDFVKVEPHESSGAGTFVLTDTAELGSKSFQSCFSGRNSIHQKSNELLPA